MDTPHTCPATRSRPAGRKRGRDYAEVFAYVAAGHTINEAAARYGYHHEGVRYALRRHYEETGQRIARLKFGPPPKTSAADILALLAVGLGRAEAARRLGVHPAQVTRALARAA